MGAAATAGRVARVGAVIHSEFLPLSGCKSLWITGQHSPRG
jgi:hypothetical protein